MSVTGAQVRPHFHTVTPYIIVNDARAAIDFYRRAFGAEELSVRTNAEGKVLHAEIIIGDSALMIAEEFEFRGVVAKRPQVLGGASMHLYLYVPDVDGFLSSAVAAGAREVMPVANQPYGERSGGVTDPFGHVWWAAAVLE
jgi:PhnB protein